VAAPGHHQGRVLGGAIGDPRQHRDAVVVDVAQRLQNLQLLDVLGEVAAGHPLVDVFVAGQRVEFLDSGLHIVARDPFPVGDRRQVDLVDDAGVVVDDAIGDIDSQFALGGHDRNPQPALGGDLGARRPDVGKLRGRVTTGEDIGDLGFGHAGQFSSRWARPSAGGRGQGRRRRRRWRR